jgi:hypothetical protein
MVEEVSIDSLVFNKPLNEAYSDLKQRIDDYNIEIVECLSY